MIACGATRAPAVISRTWPATRRMRNSTLWTRRYAPLFFASVLAACAAEPDSPWPGVLRLIEPDPGELFEPGSLLAEDGRNLDQDALKKAGDRPWKVDLDHDVRSCVLAPAGRIIEWSVTVPPSAVLNLSYAWLAARGDSMAFRIGIRDASGAVVSVFDERVAGFPAPSWHDAVVDLGRFAERQLSIVFETRGESGPESGDGIPVWANPTIWAPRSRAHPNVILVSIDTLRADHLSLYGYQRSTTPNLEAWVSRSAVTFRNAVAQATSTYPSHVSLFSGMNAFRHGVRTPLSPPRSLELMADRLRREGFFTAAVTGGAFLHPRLGLARGFDRFYYWPNRKQDAAEVESGIEKSIGLLRNSEHRPLFLFFHTYEVHTPYLPREPFFSNFLEFEPPSPIIEVNMTRSRRFQPERGFIRQPNRLAIAGQNPSRMSELPADVEVAIARAAYDASIAFTDSHLARLLEAAESLTPDRPPVIIITSDHGESLGEHDEMGHGNLFDDNLLVPLVIALSDRGHAGRSVEQQVRSIDILPTILDDLQLSAADGIDGRSLLPLLREGGARSRPAWSYSAIGNLGLALRLDNRRKYILNNTAWQGIPEREVLYDLEADPAETENLASRNLTETAELRRRVTRALDEVAVGLRVQARNGLDSRCSLHLKGDLLHLRAVKRDRLIGPELRWQGPEAADLILEPGEQSTLRFENKGRTKLHIRGVALVGGGQVTASQTVDSTMVSASEKLSWILDPESGWLEMGNPSPHGCSISVWRQGLEGAPVAALPRGVDKDMQARLRALGYVE